MDTLNIEIKVSKKEIEKVFGWSGKVKQAADDGIQDAAFFVLAKIKYAMKNTPKTGRTYRRGKSVFHTASSPGNPPAIDTGRLINSERINKYNLSRDIGSSVVYAEWLEGGTKRGLKARPVLQPTVDKYKDRILEIVMNSINKVFK